MKLLDALKSTLTLGLLPASDGESKSLRDTSFTGETVPTGSGAMGVVRSDYGPTARLFKKQNVRTLRNYAEFSIWVRAAIDIYRDMMAQAQSALMPADPTKPVNEKVKKELTRLFAQPNNIGKTYATIREEMVEDFLVLGHGVAEIGLRNNATPYSVKTLDAAKFAFINGWEGNPRTPRYAILDGVGLSPSRYLADQMAMVMVSRSRSYDLLGLSHIETLDIAIRALLETDAYFLRESQEPSKAGAFDLGKGVTQPQVDEMRSQINAVKRPFIVMGGTENAQYIPFTASERELRMLDRQTWFVRQVAAIFQVPISKLQVKAEGMNRASTEAQFEEMDEGPGAVLNRFCQIENESIVKLFGSKDEHNIVLDYPILSQKDEKRQAEITTVQTGGNPWVSINEARRDAGKEPIALTVADEILIKTRTGVIPLAVLQQQHFTPDGKVIIPPDKESNTEPENENADPADDYEAEE